MTDNNAPADGMPYVPACAEGERCSMCGDPAVRKVCENIFDDDPQPIRHELTAYVCLEHFEQIMGRSGYTRAPASSDRARALEPQAIYTGWFIPFDTMSEPAKKTFRQMMDLIKRGGQVDVVARCNGKDYRWECDGLKYAKPAPNPYKFTALSTPSEPSITLRELKALAEGMKRVNACKCGLVRCIENFECSTHNAALDQIVEAAEKAGG